MKGHDLYFLLCDHVEHTEDCTWTAYQDTSQQKVNRERFNQYIILRDFYICI